jgi:transposase
VLTLSPSRRLYVCLEPADMRKSVDGLAAVARGQAGNEVLEGHLFLFRNRRGDRLKVLFWDRNGFCILYKRLERGRFSFPPAGSGRIVIDETTFQFLLGGLSLESQWNRASKVENNCIL